MQQARKSTARPANHNHRPTATCVLNLTVIYEDSPTRLWAGEVCERVSGLLGSDCVRCAWWKLAELGEPAVLAGAVSTALHADVLVVAIHAAEALPLPFYVWVRSWLAHRDSRLAALVALIALPTRLSLAQDRAQSYLRSVARNGNLDFLLEERKLGSLATESAPASVRRVRPQSNAEERAGVTHVH